MSERSLPWDTDETASLFGPFGVATTGWFRFSMLAAGSYVAEGRGRPGRRVRSSMPSPTVPAYRMGAGRIGRAGEHETEAVMPFWSCR